MIRSDPLLGYVHAEPFRPFRIVMTSGKTYDVRHPEMLNVGRDVASTPIDPNQARLSTAGNRSPSC